MTYLQLVNAVLKRLRENSVTSVTQKTYSTMVGEFVNDAKRIVEGAWDWTHNRASVTIPTVDGTAEYTLTGKGPDCKIISVYETTIGRRMVEMHPSRYRDLDKRGVIPDGEPTKWSWSELDASDDAQLNIYPTPDAVYSVDALVWSYQADLSADTDVIQIPSLPVVLLATAMLAEEKGETGGQTSKRYFEMADKIMDDAIARDAAKMGTEVDFREA